ncbi:MAG: hypothetical protein ACLPPF_03695 [Rhodomicrobium sp.]
MDLWTMIALWAVTGAAAAFLWLRRNCNHMVCNGPQCIIFKSTLVILFVALWPIMLPVSIWVCASDEGEGVRR